MHSQIELNWEFSGSDMIYYNIKLINALDGSILVSDMLLDSIYLASHDLELIQIVASLKNEFIGCIDVTNACHHNSCGSDENPLSCLSGGAEYCAPCYRCSDENAINYFDDLEPEEIDNNLCIYPVDIILPETVEAISGESISIPIQVLN